MRSEPTRNLEVSAGRVAAATATLICAMSMSMAVAQTPPAPSAPGSGPAAALPSPRRAKPRPSGDKSEVLDFEADVIEGKKQRPDFLLQTGTQSLTMEAILYGRGNFNDFQQIEQGRRPGYLSPAPTKASP